MFTAGLLLVLAGLGALVGLKVYPTYTEFRYVQAACERASRGATVGTIQLLFNSEIARHEIEAVSGKDLDIEKEGAGFKVAFKYAKKIKIFQAVGLEIVYQGQAVGSGPII